MTKKSIIIRLFAAIAALSLMLPAVLTRVDNEDNNRDVIVAMNYNNFEMTLSKDEFDKALTDYKAIGVKTAVVAEESVNSLISAGYITGIKYNVLCHKYDDESEEIIKILAKDPNIHNDSYVLVTKRQDCKDYLDLWLPAKYKNDEFVKLETDYNATVYVIYEGAADAWQISTGFVVDKIKKAKENGYDVALSMMVGNYSTAKYIDIIEDLIKEYDIRFINLKSNYRKQQVREVGASRNYNPLCDLIKKYKLTLILTENQDQLSNQKPFGYNKLVSAANGRVIRCYETFDMSGSGETDYHFRYYQMLNSVIDRNTRFVNMTQLTNGTDTFESKNERTLKAADMFIKKINRFGYNTSSFDTDFSSYNINRRLTSAAAMVLMIIMGLTMLQWLMSKRSAALEIVAAAGAVLSIPFTYLAPEPIILLYPSLYAIVAPCFCITLVFVMLRAAVKKLSLIKLILMTAAVTLVSLCICGYVQLALLSGPDYCINTLIFRGIKLSLIAPILYGAAAYGIIFCTKRSESVLTKIPALLNAQIKVFWVIIAGFVGIVGLIYIIRSGNVKSISGAENFMRNTITEKMAARPRTKEFFVGWPCLILFVYYLKRTDIKLVQWLTGIGASILFASVINSFCHVFTAAEIIYMRVINGFWIGAILSAVVFVGNLVLVKVVSALIAKIKEETAKNGG